MQASKSQNWKAFAAKDFDFLKDMWMMMKESRTILLHSTYMIHFLRQLLSMNWETSLRKRGGSGSFVLKSNSNSGGDSPVRIRTAKYSIALQYLILEGITEDSEQ